MKFNYENKYKKLTLSILLDAIGYISFLFPPFIFDVFWAPLSAFLMTKLYKGKRGKVAAAISFIEEILPGLDIIPTFTLMWLYTFVFNKEKSITIIDV